nr:DDE-type integrase/transposase/recombinase [Clostridium manihotivorum]
MDIHAIYPKPNLSKPAKGHKIYPYLLRNVDIVRPNQSWSIDITYIRLKHGFVYLTAIIDWHSRLIVGWELDDTLSTNMVKSALEKAFSVAKPETLNSDQGGNSQVMSILALWKTIESKLAWMVRADGQTIS